ncbi:MAG: sulfotransferase [Pseudomonadota bacterium]
MDTPPFTPPAFIVGVGRSGTTLLASILNRHPRVAVTSETHYFRLLGEAGGWEAVARAWPDSAVAFLRGLHQFHLLQMEPHAVVERVRQPSEAALFQALGDRYAEQAGKPLWIEKTPLHLRHLPRIRRLFPHARVLHILRDGRDVAASLCKVRWASDGYVQNLHRWRTELAQAEPFLAQDPHTLTLRYEDLLAAPEATVARACEFLGVEFVPAMLVPDGSEWRLCGRDTRDKRNIALPLLSDNSGKWATALDPALALGAQWLFRADLERWGYEVVSPPPAGRLPTPRSELLCDDPDHIAALPLGDAFVAAAAARGLAIELTP